MVMQTGECQEQLSREALPEKRHAGASARSGRIPATLTRHSYASIIVLALGLLAAAVPASAQTDEIQVYDGGLAPKGVFNLTLHSNFTPSGIKEPSFPGAVVADKSFNGVPEWALGVTDWFEAGLYMPLYSRDNETGWGLNGFKLRALFAVPKADDRRFFYGANFEFSINAKRWDTSRFTSEVRPIIGWHLDRYDIIVNPIVDTAYDGLGNLDFAPSTRLAFNPTKTWAVAAEGYFDFGPLHDLYGSHQRGEQIYGVFDHTGGWMDIEGGIGFGLNSASDKVTLKLILSKDLNKK